MNEAQIYQEQIDAMSAALKAEFDGLDSDLLYKRPAPSANTAGFLYWHILRIWDLDLNHFIKTQAPDQDLWHRGGYSEKSGYDPDGKGLARLAGMGLGYSDEEVDEVSAASLDALHDYHNALMAETTEFLSGGNDMRAEFTPAGRPAMTAAQRLQHLVGHTYGHVGDIRFVKGLLGHTDATYPKG